MNRDESGRPDPVFGAFSNPKLAQIAPRWPDGAAQAGVRMNRDAGERVWKVPMNRDGGRCHLWRGEFRGNLMADLGADVVRVEPPGAASYALSRVREQMLCPASADDAGRRIALPAEGDGRVRKAYGPDRSQLDAVYAEIPWLER